jgi:hypothetical protein
MTYTDLGTSKSTGRARKAKQKQPDNLSQLLVSLYNDYPKDTKPELRERFYIAVSDLIGAKGNEAFLSELSGFWFDLHYPKLCRPAAEPTPRPSAAEREAEAERKAETIVRGVRKDELLNMMIGSKRLRDLTREECSEIGGWLNQIAGKLKPGQKVGEALTEKQVAALYRK